MAAANVGWGVTSEHTISDCGMKDDTAFGTIFGIHGSVGLGRKKPFCSPLRSSRACVAVSCVRAFVRV